MKNNAPPTVFIAALMFGLLMVAVATTRPVPSAPQKVADPAPVTSASEDEDDGDDGLCGCPKCVANPLRQLDPTRSLDPTDPCNWGW